MTLTGKMLIGQHAITGNSAAIRAINPATDLPLEPAYPGGSGEHVEQACALAQAAFDSITRPRWPPAPVFSTPWPMRLKPLAMS